MNIKKIGNIEIFRPADHVESRLYSAAKNNLLSKYTPGKISDSAKITEVMNTQFKFYQNILDQSLPVLASRGFLEFLLFQYDQYSLVEQKYKERKLSSTEEKSWIEYGSLSRRGIKYLLELTCHYQIEDVNPNTERNKLNDLTSTAFIAAEEMCHYYMTSDQTHSVFPSNTVLTIDPSRYNYLDLQVVPEHDITFDIRDDTNNRYKYVGKVNILNDFQCHNEILGQAFIEKFGFDYSQGIGILSHIIEHAVPVPDGFPVCFVNFDGTINQFASQLDIDFFKTKSFIEGFSIRLDNMKQEGREIFKPKQEHRALKRGFYIYNHSSGEHLAFSKHMAKECLMYLTHEIVFKKIPYEWKSPKIESSLNKLSNKAGAWFEKKVLENIQTIGMVGVTSVKKLTLKNKNILIPADVGEIDIISYSEVDNSIIIFECKLIKPATEPKFFRDDLHQFIYSKKSFKDKFLKKITWVTANISDIAAALKHKGFLVKDNYKLACALTTYYPTVASTFIDEFPCISIAKLMDTYHHSGCWPFGNLLDN